MRWSRPFDPDAEAIWVDSSLRGPTGEVRRLILVLDPGTPETIVDWDLTDQIGLDRSRSIGPARYHGMEGPQDGYYVVAPDLKVLGRSVKGFRIACCPFNKKLETDGLLGLDFVRKTVLTLDSKVGMITLED
jgi:hypothetical protein